MIVVPLTAIDDYWRCDPLLHYKPIADRILRKTFREIHRFLHFVDKSIHLEHGDPGYDRLGKVRPMIEMLQERFFEAYQPHTIPLQGRGALKLYVPAKPIKRGIKGWCRADAHNGRAGLHREIRLSSGDAWLGKETGRKKYHLYFDNFFLPSLRLTLYWVKGFYACGKARQTTVTFQTP